MADMIRVKELHEEARTKQKSALALMEKPDRTEEEYKQALAMRDEAKAALKEAADIKSLYELDIPSPETISEKVAKAGGHHRHGENPEDFDDFKDYVGALWNNYHTGGSETDSRLKKFNDVEEGYIAGKAMSGTVGSSVGFVLPQPHYDTLMQLALPQSIVRRYNPTVIPMSSRSIILSMLEYTGNEEGGGLFAGLVAAWQSELADMASSDLKVREETLYTHLLTVYATIPEATLEDASSVLSISDYLMSPRGMPAVIAFKEDKAFLRGNGIGMPLGILNATGTKAVTRTTGGTIKYEDLAEMESSHYGANPVWLATHRAKKTLRLIQYPDSQKMIFSWGDITKGVPATLLGMPIEFVDKLPGVGNKGDIMLADFSYYMIGDRKRVSSRFSTEHLFRSNQIAFKSVARVGGQPWLPDIITFDNGDTVSPFVVLDA